MLWSREVSKNTSMWQSAVLAETREDLVWIGADFPSVRGENGCFLWVIQQSKVVGCCPGVQALTIGRCCYPSWHIASWNRQRTDWGVATSGWPLMWIASVKVYKRKRRWGTVDTFLQFQPLLLCFKSKQAQNLSRNKATLYTQYHAKSWKQRLSETIFTINLKRVLYLSSVPYAWGTFDMSMGCTWPVNKRLGCMHCIMFTWCPCKIGTCWLPLHFFFTF